MSVAEAVSLVGAAAGLLIALAQLVVALRTHEKVARSNALANGTQKALLDLTRSASFAEGAKSRLSEQAAPPGPHQEPEPEHHPNHGSRDNDEQNRPLHS